MKQTLLIVLIALFSNGCSITSPGGVSESNVPITDYGYVEVVGPVSGADTSVHLLWFLPLSKPDLRQAMDRAMRQANADALVDITWEVTYTNWVLLPIMTAKVKVNGTAVRFRE